MFLDLLHFKCSLDLLWADRTGLDLTLFLNHLDWLKVIIRSVVNVIKLFLEEI